MRRRNVAVAIATVTVAVAAGLAINAWLPAQQRNHPAYELPASLKVKPLVAKEGDDQLRKLRIARYNAALSEARTRFAPESDPKSNLARYSIGATDQAVVRLFEAELRARG